MLKRCFDLAISLFILFWTAPLLLLIYVLIKLDSKGPALFLQERAGKDGIPFNIYKFRTMVLNASDSGYFTGKDDQRITRIGNILRKTSLDELPQIFNIIKGEMSIIGPRPTLMYQIKEYDKEQWKRLLVRPGVTGWAQVNGRNSLSWPERIKLDVWYVQHYSFILDIKIFLMTFKVWVKGEGVYAEKEKFVVNNKDTKEL